MNTTLIGSMIGVNFGVTDYVFLGVVSILFVIMIILLFVFVSVKKKRVDLKNISLVKEDLSKVGLAKKKRLGKYFWD